ncbi:conserved Plasmodium protein, unknown function [Plasmodium knowlesi strain H]|uniref:Uncharacterized protein n=3 Tax=Plasmodium knowlesi TaxID=5850 RepID=A0A5K1U7R0_PLAKH|nr:heptatricopeptide repeat-containing protein, putative [Plasmodium knowlesi strain H]OTN67546.1 Uncharacterized protein PKNOH_S06423900 [Plasmodium knowlesi]CAA9987512.1 heptatricopeptide repeat-containing protein, putative [Plasmodium knowlesi strain H]SBO23151.1 conserved Plasmodium protein, unknown function [Plasmodium knowlesi strain H]SBO23811.1 conserved Plasmodium protein, unknown function [Plasmodium knowlesi strain H]VVS76986.1 heptatricopeptide repeat-containing protein, putative [|eukprot:XP_002258513.1 hypothetical protein, conserved in Plasmodium species [Plasmodium knowlesi strain H]
MRIGYLKCSHRKTGLLHDLKINGSRKSSFVSVPSCGPNDEGGKYDDIENVKNEGDLKNFFLHYSKKDATELMRDYELLTSGTLKRKCSLSEVIECRNILKYVVDTTSVVHFLRSKGGGQKSAGTPLTAANESHHTSGPNNVYYIHNIEKPKINRNELIRTSRNNPSMNALLNNNMHKFIYRLKKCDILNYKERVISKEHVNYCSLLFPLTYINLRRAKETEADSYFMDTNIFYHYVNRRNSKGFMEILKHVKYRILSAQEIKNGLLLLSILHHNNICMSNDKSNIVKCAGTSEVLYKNEDYVNKKMLQDIFMTLCQGIYSKLDSISFLHLYDYLLLMCINEVKHKEVYAGIVNRLSQYANVINKITNDLNRSDETGEPLSGGGDTVDGSAATVGSGIQTDHPREDPLGLEVEPINGVAPGWTNHSTSVVVHEEGDQLDGEEDEWAENIAQGEDSRFYLRKDHRQHIKNNLITIKNILLQKVLLVYMAKYLFSHIDSNILYAHSDLICENLELMTHHMITNYIFTIGTCKHVDEFCMFMLAKYVQNYVHTYTPNEITIIVNTYADASLEDVSFYETICEHMKRNFETFSSIDIIKIIYAFSKVRIRDEELLKMAYEKINNYLEERERKLDDMCVQVKGQYLQWESEKKKKKKNFSTHYNSDTAVQDDCFPDGGDHHMASCNTVYEDKQNKRNVKRKKYVINKYLCAYALIAAGKLDYVEELDKLFVHLRNTIRSEGIDIRGVLWMPMVITSLLSSECIFHFLPIYVNLIYNAFKKTQSPKLLSLLIRRHSILLHTIETDIIPKKYISKSTLNNLYYICKTKKDNSKEKVFIPDSSTFHIEVSNALLSLDIVHRKEVNIYPFTIDILISRSGNNEQKEGQSNNTQRDSRRAAAPSSYGTTNFTHDHTAKEKKKIHQYDNDTNFEHTFETKKVKKKSQNKNEVYTDVPIA